MNKFDERDLISEIHRRDSVKIELGCGWNKRDKEAIGIDIDDYPCVDFVANALDALQLLPDSSIDEISSHHFLEHIKDIDRFFIQVARTLKKGGTLVTTVPHHSNPFFYSDPTHHQFFGLYTFGYFAKYAGFSRCLPEYSKVTGLEISEIELVFKSYRPHYLRYAIKKLIGSMFNICDYTKELYEENFCWLIPCYEIRCVIVKSE